MTEGSENKAEQQGANGAGAGQATTAEGQDKGRTFTQEEVNRFLANDRRANEAKYSEALEKAKRFDEIEEKSKSELQRATERADQLAKDLEAERSARLRLEVAQESGLPAELAARLRGDTKEELQADAEALAKLLPQQQQANPFRDAQGQAPDSKSGDWLRDSLAAK